MKQKSRKRKPATRPVSRSEKRAITIICAFLAIVILGLGSYAAGWYANRARIRGDASRYRSMYNPPPIEASTPTAAPTAAPTVTIAPTAEPTVTIAPTAAPTATAPAITAPLTEMPAVVDQLIPTPNPDTLVYALPTAPPVQPAFEALLAHNPDTIGYLEIGEMLSLPVVQRENDNGHYLDHNFDGEASNEGALFLDGVNRLVPEDDCLIVYGHNMRNGTMFGSLDAYEAADFMRAHPVVRFDTLYENRLYTPFAAFTASMEPGDRHYFDVRQFIFDETAFELFTLKMQARSRLAPPVDVRYGDRLLLLVTCDYTNQQGRFILALRQLRPGETETSVRRLFEAMD